VSLTSLITDDYERRARLRPALLVSLPLALLVASLFTDFSGLQFLVGFAAYFGLTALVAQLGRDEGKRLEPWLFGHWGGKPTTQLLRHASTDLDTNTKARYHAALSTLLPGHLLPSPAAESNDRSSADAAYDSCAIYLRDRTRDKSQFPLVYAENVNYGFRRNLWGMKKTGVVIAAASLVATVTISIVRSKEGMPPVVPAASSLLNSCMLVWWLLRINPSWVRVPAFAYAQRLLAACDTLHPPATPKKEIIVSAN
jgi:hypothetical protein